MQGDMRLLGSSSLLLVVAALAAPALGFLQPATSLRCVVVGGVRGRVGVGRGYLTPSECSAATPFDDNPAPVNDNRPTPSSALFRARGRGALKAALDPHEAASFIHTQLPAAVEQSRFLLQALQGVADAAVDAVEPATEAAKAAAANNGGWLAGPIGAIEKSIVFIHEVLQKKREGVGSWVDSLHL
jgi:hypothetical protein